jgi:hypothetical protein
MSAPREERVIRSHSRLAKRIEQAGTGTHWRHSTAEARKSILALLVAGVVPPKLKFTPERRRRATRAGARTLIDPAFTACGPQKPKPFACRMASPVTIGQWL